MASLDSAAGWTTGLDAPCHPGVVLLMLQPLRWGSGRWEQQLVLVLCVAVLGSGCTPCSSSTGSGVTA